MEQFIAAQIQLL
jgi:hypothetical protein